MASTNINVRMDSALKQEAETKAVLSEYEEMKKIRINTNVMNHLMKF